MSSKHWTQELEQRNIYERKNSSDNGLDAGSVDRIVCLYEEKSKNFIRIFALLIGLGVFFLFMIFLPYISILQINNETSQKLNGVQALQANFATTTA